MKITRRGLFACLSGTALAKGILGKAVSQVGRKTFAEKTGCLDAMIIPAAVWQGPYFDLDALVAERLGVRLGRLVNRQGQLIA